MNGYARLVAAIAAVAAVIVVAILIIPRSSGPGVGAATASPTSPVSTAPVAVASPSSPLSSPTPFPSPPPLPTLDASFVSPWYGYEVGYPSGWSVTPGAGPWARSDGMLGHGNARLDQIATPSGYYRMRLAGASMALPAGWTLAKFRAFASPPDSRCAPLIDPLTEPVRLRFVEPEKNPQQVEAIVSMNGCGSLSDLGGDIYDVVVVAGGRGYDFTLDGNLTAADARAWLAAITLEPYSAPGPGQTPDPSSP